MSTKPAEIVKAGCVGSEIRDSIAHHHPWLHPSIAAPIHCCVLLFGIYRFSPTFHFVLGYHAVRRYVRIAGIASTAEQRS